MKTSEITETCEKDDAATFQDGAQMTDGEDDHDDVPCAPSIVPVTELLFSEQSPLYRYFRFIINATRGSEALEIIVLFALFRGLGANGLMLNTVAAYSH